MQTVPGFDLAATLQIVKTIAEILALLGAATFFVYKVRAGYHIVNVAISVATDRRTLDSAYDHLGVAVTLRKGAHGSLKLHDARVRITWRGGEAELPLIGIERLSFTKDTDDARRCRAAMDRISKSKPYLHITPDEEATFSCLAIVPRTEPCAIEAAVTGTEVGGKAVGQWRSSVVALPREATAS